MKARISLITLGVDDLVKSRDFYERLGFVRRKESNDSVIFFELCDRLTLALFPREALAQDANVSSDGQGFRGVALAHNVATEAEVDEVIAHAVACGATLVKPAQKVFWGGYSGYFADPDGFLWEVACNPFMDLV